jgi:hypothetical protein
LFNGVNSQLNDQGYCDLINPNDSTDYPSLNVWSDCAGGNFNFINQNNSGDILNLFYSLDDSLSCGTFNNINQFECDSSYYLDRDTICTSRTSEFSPVSSSFLEFKDLEIISTNIENQQLFLDSLKNELQVKIDCGDQISLLHLIENSSIADVKLELDSCSPFLSDTALKASIDRIYSVDSAFVADLLIANSGLSSNVLEFVSTHYSGLFGAIEEFQGNLSAIRNLYSQYSVHYNNYMSTLRSMILLDDLDNNIDTVINELKSDSNYAAQELLFLLAMGDTAYQNYVENAYRFLSHESIEISELRRLQIDFYYSVYTQSEDLDSLTSVLKNRRIYISSSGYTEFTRGYQEYIFPPDIAVEVSREGVYDEFNTNNISKFKIYPNPTIHSDYVSVELTLPLNDLSHPEMQVFNSSGVLVNTTSVKQKAFQLQKPTHSGFYMVVLKDGNKVVETHKWIVL